MIEYNCFWPNKFSFLLPLLLCFFVLSEAANNEKDSLYAVMDQQIGSDKISTQLELAELYFKNSPDEAYKLASDALLEAKAIKSKPDQVRAYMLQGKVFREKNNNEKAIKIYETALAITQTLDDKWDESEVWFLMGVSKYRQGMNLEALDAFYASVLAGRHAKNFKIVGSSYSMMGTIFRLNGLYDRAIEYSIKAKLNYSKSNFTEGEAWVSYILGRIYADLHLNQEALTFFRESLEIYTVLAKIDENYFGVAMCYEQIGLLNIQMGDMDEAQRNIDSTSAIHTKTGSTAGMSNVYKHYGIIEHAKKNFEKSDELLEKARLIKVELNELRSLPMIYAYLGLNQIEQNQLLQGIELLQKGLQHAKTNNQKKVQLEIYSFLSESYLANNDYKNAVLCQDEQIQIQRLLLSGSAYIKTEQLQAIFEIDEKNEQILALEQQNTIKELRLKQNRTVRNLMIAGIVLALLFVGILYFMFKKIKHNNLALNASNAAKDKFFAIIAHDLRSPISAQAGLIDYMHNSFDSLQQHELKKNLLILHKSADNVSSLLENLLIWVQSQVNKIEYRPKQLDLCKILSLVQDGLQAQANNKSIEIAINCSENLNVKADPDMLKTIARNLLSNAIKFTRRNGKVSIQASAIDNKTVEVQIIDNGVGIDNQKIDLLFDISNTHHTQGTENEKSTGLGLILVKDFVEKNQGSIQIKSKLGEGTTVSFTLLLA